MVFRKILVPAKLMSFHSLFTKSHTFCNLFAENLMTTFSMWESLCLRYLGVIFHPSGTFCDQNVRFLPRRKYYCGEVSLPICCYFPSFHICLPLLKYIFYLTCSFVLPCRFSSEWHHLCPRYLGVIFHRSGTICAQNVRFYLEAIIVHGEVILPICC